MKNPKHVSLLAAALALGSVGDFLPPAPRPTPPLPPNAEPNKKYKKSSKKSLTGHRPSKKR